MGSLEFEKKYYEILKKAKQNKSKMEEDND